MLLPTTLAAVLTSFARPSALSAFSTPSEPASSSTIANAVGATAALATPLVMPPTRCSAIRSTGVPLRLLSSRHQRLTLHWRIDETTHHRHLEGSVEGSRGNYATEPIHNRGGLHEADIARAAAIRTACGLASASPLSLTRWSDQQQ